VLYKNIADSASIQNVSAAEYKQMSGAPQAR